MKSTKRRPRIRPLPVRAGDAATARWALRHDVFDRLDRGLSEVEEDHRDLDRLLDQAVFEGNGAQINMRVPAAMKAVLARLARQRTVDATTLARIWLSERIRQEIGTR